MFNPTASFLALSCVDAFATAPASAEEPTHAKPATVMPDDSQDRRDVIFTGERE